MAERRSSGQLRVALFGGSFDPPHRGHVAIALAAADSFSLDRVFFAPTGRQPLKPLGASASFEDRSAMVKLACELDHRFEFSDLDAPRTDGRPNYTVNALIGLAALWPGAELFAIAGADSFLELPRWHRSDELLRLAEWIVISRPGFALDAEQFQRTLPLADPSRFHWLRTVCETVSATELRARLRQGDDCSEEIPDPVMRYIDGHNLYR